VNFLLEKIGIICKQLYDSIYRPKIFISPNVLVIILNRGRGNIYDVKLDFCETIDITQFVEKKDSPQLIYNLYGVIPHIGLRGPNSLFIASCKSPIDNKWYRYYDSIVTPIINFQKEIIEFGFPYILFYQKKYKESQLENEIEENKKIKIENNNLIFKNKELQKENIEFESNNVIPFEKYNNRNKEKKQIESRKSRAKSYDNSNNNNINNSSIKYDSKKNDNEKIKNNNKTPLKNNLNIESQVNISNKKISNNLNNSIDKSSLKGRDNNKKTHKIEENNIYNQTQKYTENNNLIKKNKQSQENKITKEFPSSFETPKNGQSKKGKSDLEKNKGQKKNNGKGNQSKRDEKENKKELYKEVIDEKDEKLKHIEQKNKNISFLHINENEYLKNLIKIKDEKIKILEQQNLDYKKKIKNEKKIEELNSQIDLLKKENNDLTKKKSKKMILNSQMDSHKKGKNDYTKYETKINELNSQIDSLKKENKDLNSKYEHKNKEIKELNSKIDSLKKENDDLIKSKSKIKELNSKIDLLKKENKDLTKHENKIKELNFQIDSIKKENIDLTSRNDELQIENIRLQTEIKNLSEKLVKIKKINPFILYNSPTLIGLNNIGATCFMNSTLQCLSQTKSLTNYFLNENNKERIINNNIASKNKNDSQLSPIYLELIQKLWEIDGSKSFSPKIFMNTVEKMNPLFKKGQDGDAQIFIIFILEQLHKELKQSNNIINQNGNQVLYQYDKNSAFNYLFNDFQKEGSIISDLFFGFNETINECLNH